MVRLPGQKLEQAAPPKDIVHSKGIVEFTEHSSDSRTLQDFGHRHRPGLRSSFNELGLAWQQQNELFSGAGYELCVATLENAGFLDVPWGGNWPKSRYLADIGKTLDPLEYSRVERHLIQIEEAFDADEYIPRKLRRGHHDEDLWILHEAFLVAVWAQNFAEPMGEIWLAAMAYHASYVEEDLYAFGYLSALLMQKAKTEEHFLRGLKTIKSASAGGTSKTRAYEPRRTAIIDQMNRLIKNGLPVSRAGALVHKSGLGASGPANAKLYQRHK